MFSLYENKNKFDMSINNYVCAVTLSLSLKAIQSQNVESKHPLYVNTNHTN